MKASALQKPPRWAEEPGPHRALLRAGLLFAHTAVSGPEPMLPHSRPLQLLGETTLGGGASEGAVRAMQTLLKTHGGASGGKRLIGDILEQAPGTLQQSEGDQT